MPVKNKKKKHITTKPDTEHTGRAQANKYSMGASGKSKHAAKQGRFNIYKKG